MINVKRIALVTLLVVVALNVMAKEKTKKETHKSAKGDVKELSGISVIGDKEAPKSLFIVPWKSSEIGVQKGLTSSLLNEKLKPVDKDVFMRELNFYAITVGKQP